MTLREADRNIRAIFGWTPLVVVPRDREGRVVVTAVVRVLPGNCRDRPQ